MFVSFWYIVAWSYTFSFSLLYSIPLCDYIYSFYLWWTLGCFLFGLSWTFLFFWWKYVHICFFLNQLLRIFWDNILHIALFAWSSHELKTYLINFSYLPWEKMETTQCDYYLLFSTKSYQDLCMLFSEAWSQVKYVTCTRILWENFVQKLSKFLVLQCYYKKQKDTHPLNLPRKRHWVSSLPQTIMLRQ